MTGRARRQQRKRARLLTLRDIVLRLKRQNAEEIAFLDYQIRIVGIMLSTPRPSTRLYPLAPGIIAAAGRG
jgi:hypothetical protein